MPVLLSTSLLRCRLRGSDVRGAVAAVEETGLSMTTVSQNRIRLGSDLSFRVWCYWASEVRRLNRKDDTLHGYRRVDQTDSGSITFKVERDVPNGDPPFVRAT